MTDHSQESSEESQPEEKSRKQRLKELEEEYEQALQELKTDDPQVLLALYEKHLQKYRALEAEFPNTRTCHEKFNALLEVLDMPMSPLGGRAPEAEQSEKPVKRPKSRW